MLATVIFSGGELMRNELKMNIIMKIEVEIKILQDIENKDYVKLDFKNDNFIYILKKSNVVFFKNLINKKDNLFCEFDTGNGINCPIMGGVECDDCKFKN